jgi:hypothetical protein
MGKKARRVLCERFEQRHALALWQGVLDAS